MYCSDPLLSKNDLSIISWSDLELVPKYEENGILKPVKIIEAPRRKGDLVEVIALNKNLKKFIKWRPKFNKLKLMVISSIKWERKI